MAEALPRPGTPRLRSGPGGPAPLRAEEAGDDSDRSEQWPARNLHRFFLLDIIHQVAPVCGARRARATVALPPGPPANLPAHCCTPVNAPCVPNA